MQSFRLNRRKYSRDNKLLILETLQLVIYNPVHDESERLKNHTNLRRVVKFIPLHGLNRINSEHRFKLNQKNIIGEI